MSLAIFFSAPKIIQVFRLPNEILEYLIQKIILDSHQDFVKFHMTRNSTNWHQWLSISIVVLNTQMFSFHAIVTRGNSHWFIGYDH